MKKVLTILFLSISLQCYSQGLKPKDVYESAFQEIKGMLKDSIKSSFKRAVFISENAYVNAEMDYSLFDTKINFYADLCRKIAQQDGLIYNETDQETIRKYAAVFRFMTDSVRFAINTEKYFQTLPFQYDFDDFWGEKNWKKMFVTKLIETQSGNCHSLPFLYKILCEEMNVPAWLSMAPNHTYIKLWCKKTGWYNTELTSGYFPIDAWIMASGYVHLNAVQNRLYMDTLSSKQSLAVCLIDLAKGYEKNFGSVADLDFITKCADLALIYYPQYGNGLILKAETMKKRFENMMAKHNARYPKDVFSIPEAKQLFDGMQNLYFRIHELGYRKMPREMYVNWLAELNKEKDKYQNKELTKGFNLKQN